LVVLGALGSLGTFPAVPPAAIVPAKLALTVRRTATPAIGLADFLLSTITAATATAIISAHLVDAVRNANVRRCDQISIGRLTILGHSFWGAGDAIDIAAGDSSIAHIVLRGGTETILTTFITYVADPPEELAFVVH